MAKFAGICGLITLSSMSLAGPTCLNVMPVADILGHRELVYQVYTSGNEKNIDPAIYWYHSCELGLFGIGEVGFDNDTLGNTTLNAKLQLYQSPGDGRFAVSAGFSNVGVVGTSIDKYIVGRADFKGFRLHGGVLWNDRARGMFGLDAPLPAGCSLMVDHITGPGSATWVGVNVPMPVKGLLLTVAGGFPTDKGAGIQNCVTLGYGFRM